MSDLHTITDRVLELNGLLEEENVSLLEGSFAGLKDIAERKMQLVRDVETFIMSASADDIDSELRSALASLKKLTDHNGALLQAAYNGSKAAQAHLGQIAGERANVGAYSMTGKRIVSSEAIVSRQKTV